MNPNIFTLDQFLTRVLPGGVLLAIILFIYSPALPLDVFGNFDILYSFIFLCFAFIVGEILQVFAHAAEPVINVFFRMRNPSRVFLYKNNPVLTNEIVRNELLEKVMIDISFDDFKTIPLLWWKDSQQLHVAQALFRELYAKVSSKDEIMNANRSYLFCRVMTIESLILAIIFFSQNMLTLGGISLIVTLVFLWRCRGVAKNLVVKTIYLAKDLD